MVTAKEALKPAAVRTRESRKRAKRTKRLRRQTDVFVRLDEWFFLPAPAVQVTLTTASGVAYTVCCILVVTGKDGFMSIRQQAVFGISCSLLLSFGLPSAVQPLKFKPFDNPKRVEKMGESVEALLLGKE